VSGLAQVVPVRQDEIVVARLQGEIDASNRAAVAQRLRDLVTNRAEVMVIDLGGVTYLDSTGIALLFELGIELRQRQQRLKVAVPPESPIARIVSLTGLERAMPVHPSVDAALSS
jgi:anti-anti-sigma factor